MGIKGIIQCLALIGVLFAGYFISEAICRNLHKVETVKAFDWNVKDDESRRLDISWMFGFMGNPDNWIQKNAEAAMNVKIDPLFVHGPSFAQKSGTYFAGGEFPEVIGFSRQLVYHGLCLEVPLEVIKKHAPNYVRLMNSIDPLIWLSTNVDGKNYGIPITYIAGTLPRPGVWRKDWLKKVGINKVPETLDEMHEALYRFRNNDPDGNGIKDTYGMSGDVSNWWWISFSEIFGAYGVLPYDWMEKDGKIVWGGLLPEAKEALGIISKWKAEDLIDPDFIIDNAGYGGNVERKFLSGKIGYIYYFGRFDYMDEKVSGSFINNLKALSPGAELAVGTFPKGPQGLRGGRIQSACTGGIAFSKKMAEHPEKVIRILKLIDRTSRDEEFAISCLIGKKGLHWDFRDMSVGPDSGTLALPPFNDKNRATQEGLAFSIITSNGFCPGISFDTWDKYTPRDELEFRKKYLRTEWGLSNSLGRSEYVSKSEEYLNDLMRMQQTVYAKIINGDLPPGHFDTFVQNWKRQGGDILLGNANRLKTERDAIFAKMGSGKRER